MSKIEKVEVEIDRVICYLDCGCVKKSDIFINAPKLAEVKRSIGKELCERHNPFSGKAIYLCKQCRIVDTVSVTRDDTQNSVFEKIYAVHGTDYSRYGLHSSDIHIVICSKDSTQESLKEGGLPTWAIDSILKFLRVGDKV